MLCLQLILIFVLIKFCRCIYYDNENLLEKEVKFVQILFRHGDRTPIETYPNDPYNDPKYWPTDWGQLTNIGKEQQYNLGKWIRKRYGNLLNGTYSHDIVYVRSTDVDRTLMSAESNLAGLFPPRKNDLWNKNINWQPIPVHTVPENLDEVLAAKKPCATYDYLESAFKNSEEFRNLNKKYFNLYKYLTKCTGQNIDSMEDVLEIHSILCIERLYNFTLPEWTKSVFPGGDMEWISNFSFALMTYTRQMARLKTGPLLKEMLKHFDDKSKQKLYPPHRSLWIYSAHDLTIGNLLNTLKLFEYHSPPYAACILLELRIINSEPFISIFYRNTSTENPPPLKIPNCGILCPLKKMFELYSDVLPIDWHEECKLSTLMLTYEEANIGFAMGVLVMITSISFVIISVYSAVMYYKRRHYYGYNLYLEVQ